MEPTSTQRRTEVMLVRAQLGQYQAAIEQAKKLREIGPKHPGILYSVARAYALCAFGLAQKPATKQAAHPYADAAIRLLAEAVANGYDTRMLERDPDLQSLRDDTGFQRLLDVKTRIGG